MDETRTAEIGIRVRTAIVRHSSRGRPQPPITRRRKPASDYDTTVVRSWRNNRPRSATMRMRLGLGNVDPSASISSLDANANAADTEPEIVSVGTKR